MLTTWYSLHTSLIQIGFCIKKILNFCQVANHKGDTIGKLVESCLLEWGIDKAFSITIDNASSNEGAISYIKKRLRS